MPRTLIIPDVHDKTGIVARILARESYDRAVFLGDWFDGDGAGGTRARATAVFVREVIEDPRHVLLLGNHDAQYLWPRVPELRCSGYSRNKMDQVTWTLAPVSRYRRRFLLYTLVDGWLVSHAGLDARLVPERASDPLAWLEEECRQALGGLEHGVVLTGLLSAGWERGGLQRCGGLTWADFDHIEPAPGLRQVVGHTRGPTVREKTRDGARLVCIDTVLRHYAYLEGGELHLKQVED